MNKNEIAAHFNRSLPTVNSWIRRGCPFIQEGARGREWDFNPNEVENWLDRQEARVTGGDGLPLGVAKYFSGNLFRDFSNLAVKDFFDFTWGSFFHGFKELCEEVGIDPGKIDLLFTHHYLLAKAFYEKYSRGDHFNRFLQGIGVDLDGLRNTFLKGDPIKKTTRPVFIEPDVTPEPVKRILEEANRNHKRKE